MKWDELLERGYNPVETGLDKESAKTLAKEYRAKGYFARIVEVKNGRIRMSSYSVFIKQKEVIE